MIDTDKLKHYRISDEGGTANIDSEIKKVTELLLLSKKPLFLAGNGIKLSGKTKAMYDFLNVTKLPVQTTWKTIDFFDEDDPLYVGHPGIMGDRGANLIMQQADLLISVGSRLDTSITAFNDEHFACNAKKVIIDIDPNELARMKMEIDVSLACDAGEFLDALSAAVEKESLPDWSGWLSVITSEHGDRQDKVCAYYFIGELCKLLKNDDVIVPESSGAAGEITYQAFKIKKGQRMKNAAGLGSMGFGLPYAIGSCIANDRRRTLLINGDGAFQLNIQELETLHRLGLPVKIFVWSNAGYASIRSMQRNNFAGRYVGSSADSGLTIPDLCAVANAYGFETVKLMTNRDVDEHLADIMKDDRPVFVEVFVDPNETVSPRVKAYVGENGDMKSGLLERMWPEV